MESSKRQKTDDAAADDGKVADEGFGKPYRSDKIGEDDRCGVRMFGMDFHSTFDDVYDFFGGYNAIPGSVILGESQDQPGRKDGKGMIWLKSEEDAEKAVAEKNREYIGKRFVLLTQVSYKQYLSFQNGGGGSGGGDSRGSRESQPDLKLSDCGVNEGNMDKALYMRGLPWRISHQEIIDFFSDYGKLSEDKIHIGREEGKNTGKAVVFFDNEKSAQDAKENLDKEKIGAA